MRFSAARGITVLPLFANDAERLTGNTARYFPITQRERRTSGAQAAHAKRRADRILYGPYRG
jgi:hypothetical protein